MTDEPRRRPLPFVKTLIWAGLILGFVAVYNLFADQRSRDRGELEERPRVPWTEVIVQPKTSWTAWLCFGTMALGSLAMIIAGGRQSAIGALAPAQHALARGDLAEARRVAESVSASHRSAAVAARFVLARTSELEGDLEAAAELYEKSANPIQSVLAEWLLGPLVQTHRERCHARAALCHAGSGRTERARSLAEPITGNAAAANAAVALLALAVAAHRDGRPDELPDVLVRLGTLRHELAPHDRCVARALVLRSSESDGPDALDPETRAHVARFLASPTASAEAT